MENNENTYEPISDVPESSNMMEAPPRKRGKKKWILLIFLIIAIAGAAFAGKMYMQKVAFDKLVTAIEKGDTDAAKKLAEEANIANTKRQLSDYAESVKDLFFNDELDYSICKVRLDVIAALDLIPDKLSEIRSAMDEMNISKVAWTTAQDYYKEQKFDKAITEFKKIIKSDPNYDAAQSLIEECIGKLRSNAKTDAQKEFDNKNFKSGFDILTNALKVMENDTELSSMLDKYKSEFIEVTITDAEALVADNKYTEAVALLTDAKKLVENERFSSEIETVWSKFVDFSIAAAEALVNDKKYEAALDLIKSAINTHTDPKLIEEQTKIELLQPKQLRNFAPIVSDRYSVADAPFTDSYGYTRTWGLSFDCGHGTAHVIFNLLKENDKATSVEKSPYTELTFTLVASPDMDPDTTINFDFYDYEKNKPLKTISNFGITSKPMTVTVDITDVNTLEIRQTCDDYGNHTCYLAEPTVK